MTTPTTGSDPVLRALADADPARAVHLSEWAATRFVRAALSDDTVTAKSSRRWKATAAVTAVVLAVGVPGAAVAAGFAAQTGSFASPNPDSPEGTTPIGTEADGSEWIEVTAPDYVDFSVSVWPDYAALPAGYDTGRFAAEIARAYVRDNAGEPALRQVTGIRSEFEQNARCAWRAEWLDANGTGDTQREQVAARTLAEAASWPATTASDAGGIVDGERAVASAAASGDRAAVEELNSWCSEMLARAGE